MEGREAIYKLDLLIMECKGPTVPSEILAYRPRKNNHKGGKGFKSNLKLIL
jgi:hypothetical protein